MNMKSTIMIDKNIYEINNPVVNAKIYDTLESLLSEIKNKLREIKIYRRQIKYIDNHLINKFLRNSIIKLNSKIEVLELEFRTIRLKQINFWEKKYNKSIF